MTSLGHDLPALRALVLALGGSIALLALTPLFAWWTRPRLASRVIGDPYRTPMATASGTTRARRLGALVGLVGALLIVIAPVAFVFAIFANFSLSPSSSDLTPGVFLALAAIGAILVGPALLVVARRVWTGAPTTRVNAAGALVLAFVLLGASAFAAGFDPDALAPCIGAALGFVVVGTGLGLALVLGTHSSSHDDALLLGARRLIGSTVLFGALVTVSAVLAWQLVDELGGRLSNARFDYPEGAAFFEAILPSVTAAAIAISVSVLAPILATVLAVRSRASLARECAARSGQ